MSGCPNIGVWWWMGFDVDGGIVFFPCGRKERMVDLIGDRTLTPKKVVNSKGKFPAYFREAQLLRI